MIKEFKYLKVFMTLFCIMLFLDMWNAELAQRRDWLLKDGNRKENKSLRMNSTINPDDFFGIPGTFRQLQID